MKKHISENDNVVISGSLTDWGGDMYTNHTEFIEWASAGRLF